MTEIISRKLTSKRNQRDAAKSKLDLPGTVLVSAGLFTLVYGFSNAESHR